MFKIKVKKLLFFWKQKVLTDGFACFICVSQVQKTCFQFVSTKMKLC